MMLRILHAAAVAVVFFETDIVLPIHVADAFISPFAIRAANYNSRSYDYRSLTVQSSSSDCDVDKAGDEKNRKRKKPYFNANNRNQDKDHRQRNNGRQTNGKTSVRLSKPLLEAKAINKNLIECNSGQEVLEYFISKGGAKGVAGGDVFNSVNFSTCMHRLARFATFVDHSKNNSKKDNSTEEQRKLILSDPRFAILIASLSEALVQPDTNKSLIFNNRELANLAWAVAKIKLTPPSKVYPITRPNEAKQFASQNGNSIVYATVDEMNDSILQTSLRVRQQVLEVAKERSVNKGAVQSIWIPTLSQLSANLLDVIASQVLGILDKFNSQELANLLYAFASAGRADIYFFDQLSKQLVLQMKYSSSKIAAKDQSFQQPKPQEFRYVTNNI